MKNEQTLDEYDAWYAEFIGNKLTAEQIETMYAEYMLTKSGI